MYITMLKLYIFCKYLIRGDIILKNVDKKATFTIQIKFTRNATWQGSISWLEEEKTQAFRSELEMLKLMTEAINISEDEEKLNNW